MYYVENITSTSFILGTNRKCMNLRIHELAIFKQTTKIDAHEEKYFHSKCRAFSIFKCTTTSLFTGNTF
jgi:hypothetical protein